MVIGFARSELNLANSPSRKGKQSLRQELQALHPEGELVTKPFVLQTLCLLPKNHKLFDFANHCALADLTNTRHFKSEATLRASQYRQGQLSAEVRL